MDEESSLGAAADAIEKMMGTEEPTQPEPNHANESEPETEPTTEQSEGDTESELVDLDLEGTTYSLPKPLHEHLAELKKQTLLHKDYTQKTMTLAEEKRQWEEAKQKEIDAAAEAKAAQYKQELELYRAAQSGAKEPDPTLLDTDPVEYLKQKAEFDKAQRAIGTLKAQGDAKHQAYVQDQTRKLMEANPEWTDQAVYSKDMGSIVNYLKSTGASEKEIADIADHRIFLMARDAAKYRALQEQKAEVTKKIHKTPVKVERPGVPSGTDGQHHRDAMARLRKSGSLDDAAAAIMAFS
jgi:hypothetical protein